MLIAIDFDGTCVTHEYPLVGRDIGATPVLRELVASGHQLMLWTMRSKGYLMDAREWFQTHEIPLEAVNENPKQKDWTDSPKLYAPLYIDDAALGAPLISNPTGRPYLDWTRTREILVARKII
jgi:hypothetical protein